MGDIILLILYAIVSFTISSLVHELGHILMGIKEGFKFHLLIVGPFGLKRKENNKIKFYFEKNPSLWGGISATVPTNEDINNFKRFGRLLLCGPLASLLFGVIWLPIGIITDNIFYLLLSAMPLGMGIASLIPARNGAFYTDGGRWLRMHKNEDTRAVELAIWNLTQDAIIQGNYSKANFDEISILIKNEDVRTKFLGHYYAYSYYKDNIDMMNAEIQKKELEDLKEKVPKQMVSIFRVE